MNISLCSVGLIFLIDSQLANLMYATVHVHVHVFYLENNKF